MSAIATVENINKVNKEVLSEMLALQQSVSSFKWIIVVPLVGDALGFGYRAVDEMRQPDQPLVANSLGQKAGFKTVGEVVTSPTSEGGLEMDWNEWERSVRAFIYRRNFSIHHDNKDEIIGEYTDITESLGHEPKDSIEYHKVKSDLIRHTRARKEQEHTEELRLVRQKLDSVSKENVSLRETEASLKLRIEEHAKELEDARSAMHQISVDYRNELANAVHAAELETSERLSATYTKRIEEQQGLILGLEKRLEDALEELSSRDSENRATIVHYESKFEAQRQDYENRLDVQKRAYSELEQSLAQSKELISGLHATAQQSEVKISELERENKILASRPSIGPDQSGEIEGFKQTIQSQTVEISELKVEVGELTQTVNAKTNEIAQLNEKVDLQATEIEEKSLLVDRFKAWARQERLKANKSVAEEKSRRVAFEAHSKKQIARVMTAHRKNSQITAKLDKTLIETKKDLSTSHKQRGVLMVITALSVAVACVSLLM